MSARVVFALSVAVAIATVPAGAQTNLYNCHAFSLTDTTVEQGVFRALARSRNVIEVGDWGYTNVIRVWLDAGRHDLAVTYGPEYRNMDGVEDSARLDHVRVIALAIGTQRKPQLPGQ